MTDKSLDKQAVSDIFPIQNGMKQGDALLPLLLKTCH